MHHLRRKGNWQQNKNMAHNSPDDIPTIPISTFLCIRHLLIHQFLIPPPPEGGSTIFYQGTGASKGTLVTKNVSQKSLGGGDGTKISKSGGQNIPAK